MIQGSDHKQPPVVYWQPAEVMLLLEWGETLVPENDTRSLSNEELWDDEGLDALYRLFEEIGTPLAERRELFYRTHNREERRPLVVRRGKAVRVMQTVNLQGWQNYPPPREDTKPEESPKLPDTIFNVARAVVELNKRAGSLDETHLGGHRLVAASPNWLALPLEYWGEGSPAGPPRPFAVTPGSAPRFFRPRPGQEADTFRDPITLAAEEMLKRQKVPLEGKATGKDVSVVIFDTWPYDPQPEPRGSGRGPAASVAPAAIGTRLEQPFSRIGERIPQLAAGTYIADLERAVAGELVSEDHIRDCVAGLDDGLVQSVRFTCDGTAEAPYDLSDHGFVIADMIKDIAPDATLWVYRVLTAHGVGDADVIATALEHAYEHVVQPADGKPVVFNLSLGFAPDLMLVHCLLADSDELHDDLQSLYAGDAGFREQALKDAPLAADAHTRKREEEVAFLEQKGTVYRQPLAPDAIAPAGRKDLCRLSGGLELLDYLFFLRDEPNLLAVAAAGNDGCPNRFPPPRVPAAVEGVLGVSSVRDTHGALAGYTNADDIFAPDDGVSALGGSIGEPTNLVPDGIIGPFVAEQIPVGAGSTANHYGHVLWEGTSFATPIAAAFAAALWSETVDRPGVAQLTAQQVLSMVVTNPDGSARQLLPFHQHWPAE